MLDILFPQRCPSCYKIPLKNHRICGTCYDDIKFIHNWSFCCICGIPFGFFNDEDEQLIESNIEKQNNLCGKCIKDFYSFHKARSIAIYEGKIRDLIISFKYEGKLSKAKSLLEILFSNFPNDLDEFDSIVAVPLHVEKLRKREYNQSVILATGIANHFGMKCDLFGLRRIRDTRPQIEIANALERRRNVKGAFSVSKNNSFKDKSILLVDDVFTSGSTSDECTKMLLKSGAYKVQVLTFTRAKAM